MYSNGKTEKGMLLTLVLFESAAGIPISVCVFVGLITALFFSLLQKAEVVPLPSRELIIPQDEPVKILIPRQREQLGATDTNRSYKNLDQCVIPFQRLWRGFHVHYMRKIAAYIIQHEWKRYLLRNYVLTNTQSKHNFKLYRYHYASYRIQRAYRVYQAEKELGRVLRLKYRCICIARAFRTFQLRWRFLLILKRKKNIIQTTIEKTMQQAIRNASFVTILQHVLDTWRGSKCTLHSVACANHRASSNASIKSLDTRKCLRQTSCTMFSQSFSM